MRAVLSASRQFVRQLWGDVMLAGVICVPILMGLLFHFGVPELEKWLCATFKLGAVLSPYYYLFDLALIIVTPLMVSTCGAMVMLEEADSGTAKALVATPLGKGGYVLSRLVISSAFSMLYGMAAAYIFHLTEEAVGFIPLLSFSGAVMGVAASLLVAALAGNRVEGMALTKLSGIAVLGIPAALLVPKPVQYLAGVFPPYWMTRAILENSVIFGIVSCLAGALWILLLWRRFEKKMLK